MIGEGAKVGARAGAFGRLQHLSADAGIDEIFVELGVVLEIDFRPALGDFVKRRLGDVEMPALDDLGHLPVEEGQQKRADVGAVDVGVRRSEEHTSELQSLMRTSYAVFCLKKKKRTTPLTTYKEHHNNTSKNVNYNKTNT